MSHYPRGGRTKIRGGASKIREVVQRPPLDSAVNDQGPLSMSCVHQRQGGAPRIGSRLSTRGAENASSGRADRSLSDDGRLLAARTEDTFSGSALGWDTKTVTVAVDRR